MIHHKGHHTRRQYKSKDPLQYKEWKNFPFSVPMSRNFLFLHMHSSLPGWAGLPYQMTGFGYSTKSIPVLKRYGNLNCIPLLLVLLGCCTLFSLCSFSSNGSTDAESIAVWGKRDIRLPSSDTSCLCLTRCSLKMSTYRKSLLFCNSVNGWKCKGRTKEKIQ